MGHHTAQSKTGPGNARPVPRTTPAAALRAAPADRPLWRAMRRHAASVLLTIGWPASLLAVIAIACGGLGIALIEPNGLGRSKDATYPLGTYIDLRPDGNAGPYLREGWSPSQEKGRRTTGLLSGIVLSFDYTKDYDLVLAMLAQPHFSARDDEFWVDVLINGAWTARWSYNRTNPGQEWRETLVRREDLRTVKPVHVTFVIGAADPVQDGSGIQIEALALRE